MEDYREKIEKLSEERLKLLKDTYQKTISQLQEQYDQATMVAMLPIADYTKIELEKKKAELAQVEAILEKRKIDQQ